MKLKSYQKGVMDDLVNYLKCVNDQSDLFSAWKAYWETKDVVIGSNGALSYNNAIKGVPHVCMKVPTGGGKTFMACASLKRIFEALPLGKPRVVVWLVPSDPILKQTIRTLSDASHPYRQKLNQDFGGRAEVYTKEMLLNAQNFSPDTVREMLTVCVLSYGSLRIDSTKLDERKVYQENGNLRLFADHYKDNDVLLADTPDTALIQVLRHLEPVVVVDESHNAGSDLSSEMLKNLNPSFVLDLTATPRKNSNIISYVDARELKKEHMVKLPIVVYKRSSPQSVLRDAIGFRNNIEQVAIEEEKKGGKYIRPIVLFQAQPNNGEKSDTFDKIKNKLVECGIPKDQIAIKTSKVDDLKNINLLSRGCKIRYIITVNALKEGWDCPFAYILASLANRTSPVEVEQIVGRILRQPYATQYKSPLLNTSYVLTSSNDFHSTLDNIIEGLTRAGYSKKDCRVDEHVDVSQSAKQKEPEHEEVHEAVQVVLPEVDEEITTVSQLEVDSFEDVDAEEVKTSLENSNSEDTTITEMTKLATELSKSYTTEVNESDNGYIGGELGSMLSQYKIQPHLAEEVSTLNIPQFFLRGEPNLFNKDGFKLLERENLSEGFKLAGLDARVNFDLATGEMYSVDVEEKGEAVPKYKYMNATDELGKYIREHVANLPHEKQIETCTNLLCKQLDSNNRLAPEDLKSYVKRIVEAMTEDELEAMGTAIHTYAKKIKEKIEELEKAYREETFKRWIAIGKIECRPSYSFPNIITPAKALSSIPDSLYEEEANDMNEEERKLIDAVLATGKVRWWHRIIDRKGFRINGFINHYPDFMVMTNSGKLLMLEFKGDDRDNSDSERKLKLGRKWQDLSGPNYRYFMVFKNRDFDHEGAYKLDDFILMMKDM